MLRRWMTFASLLGALALGTSPAWAQEDPGRNPGRSGDMPGQENPDQPGRNPGRKAKPDEKPGADEGAPHGRALGQNRENSAWMRAETDGAIFEQPRFGGEGRLFVRDRTDASARTGRTGRTGANAETSNRFRVFSGNDLDSIVSDNELDANASIDLDGLRTNIDTDTKLGADATFDPTWTSRFSAGDLTFESSSMWPESRLFVDRDGERYAYFGRDLDAIVQANPDLRTAAGLNDLRTHVRSFNELDLGTTVRGDVDGSTQVLFEQGPRGITARTWAWENGRWVDNTYRVNDWTGLRTHPQFRETLTWWSGADRGDVVPRTMPTSRRVETVTVHGVTFEKPTSCLNRQLGLSGTGLVVTNVESGSVAQRLGLRSDDIVLSVNGNDVREVRSIEQAFKAGQASDLELTVLRDGQRVELSANQDASLRGGVDSGRRMPGQQPGQQPGRMPGQQPGQDQPDEDESDEDQPERNRSGGSYR